MFAVRRSRNCVLAAKSHTGINIYTHLGSFLTYDHSILWPTQGVYDIWLLLFNLPLASHLGRCGATDTGINKRSEVTLQYERCLGLWTDFQGYRRERLGKLMVDAQVSQATAPFTSHSHGL